MEKSESLSDVNKSIDVTNRTKWKKFFAFLGPAYLVSVGYMDPGNWATDIAGGSQYGYTLIWVLLMSNLMALLLQSLSARLGIIRGRDLAQISRETYPRFINIYLYILAEIAIAACDLAEVIGMAIGLQLLFDIPLLWGVLISVFDTFILLLLMHYGIRKLEAFILSLVLVIGISFFIELFIAKPEMGEVVKGLIPCLPDSNALYIAIGIIGATVMPHNLYLHSSLVQTRKFSREKSELKKAIKFNFIDSVVALNMAFFVNASILILAASAFYKNGFYQVAEIQDAHKLLQDLLGSKWAPILFAFALLCAGQSSTITGTLAGQIVMEGYLNLRIQPWIRRLITRILAIAPAAFVIYFFGESQTGQMLIFSQVLLSIQLGFAIVPLIHSVSDKQKMGDFAIGTTTKVLSWLSAGIIILLNLKLVAETVFNSLRDSTGYTFYLVLFIVVPIFIFSLGVLLYLTFTPLLSGRKKNKVLTPHGNEKDLHISSGKPFLRIAVTVDFSDMDEKAISSALAQGGVNAGYCLIHIVETPTAMVYGKESSDLETHKDKQMLDKYQKTLNEKGFRSEVKLGFGNPKSEIPKLAAEYDADLLVMGVHGHNTFMDLILGTTVEKVRHGIKIPILIVNR